MHSYDIIIAGAGLAGLTLALELSRRPAFAGQRILLLDRDPKQQNDRTWCFWAKPEDPLPPVVYREWESACFYGPSFDIPMKMRDYRYCMVRGKDFYDYARQEIAKNPNLEWRQATIRQIIPEESAVVTNQGRFTAKWIFNSAFVPVEALTDTSTTPFAHPHTQTGGRPEGYSWLLQHFKGWEVETPEPRFDPETVTFMDFRIEQNGETRFVYVLPFTEYRALVEFTVFSPSLLPVSDYDEALKDYLWEQLGIANYHIAEEEFGVIPMSDYAFPIKTGASVIHIGTAGGFVKASSGYAFKRTQRKIRRLVDDWEATGTPHPEAMQSLFRFRMYDSILLRVLEEGRVPGALVFERLFRHLPASHVLRFLDEDTNLKEEIQLMSVTQLREFTRAAVKQLSKYGRV